MTKYELEIRADEILRLLKNAEFYSEDDEIEAEYELAKICMMLTSMKQLEAE